MPKGAFEDITSTRLLPLGRLRSRKRETESLHPLKKKATILLSLWHLVVGVVHLLVRMSRGERRGLSSRPQHHRDLLYFLLHHQQIMEYSCKAQAPAPVPQGHDHGGPSIMERFKRMAPPSLKGESDPLLAESWTREIEKIFRAIRCVEEDKERADVWWASLLQTRFKDGAVEVAWDKFVRLFQTMFVPEHIKDKME
ncbi:hypothetical protein Taro_022429 [Colocasia esculenta]|uniref:Retrotransposon gag domain-containing protein n=1 Tax=Colocasia esculenta TaxID=4460 RepID=A0A843V1J7_COLES|nr:hypothetical protein [Colocasia esculenta]